MSSYDPTQRVYRASTQSAQGYQQPPGYAPPPSYYGYGTPPPAPRKSKLPWIIIGIVLAFTGLLAAAIIAGPPEEDTGTDGGQSEAAAEQPAAGTADGQDVYAIGQTANTGGSDVTVHTVTDPYTDPSGFIAPSDGMRWVAVEATITNPTDELVVWSSLLGAEVTDSQNRGWSIALAGSDLPQLGGDIPIQGERRGWVVFEVPADATGLRLRIKGNLTATGSLFQLTP